MSVSFFLAWVAREQHNINASSSYVAAKILQQISCSKDFAANILQQISCSKYLAAKILQKISCSKYIAANILQQRFCSKPQHGGQVIRQWVFIGGKQTHFIAGPERQTTENSIHISEKRQKTNPFHCILHTHPVVKSVPFPSIINLFRQLTLPSLFSSSEISVPR